MEVEDGVIPAEHLAQTLVRAGVSGLVTVDGMVVQG